MRQRVLLRWHEVNMFEEARQLGLSISLSNNAALQDAYICLITTMVEQFITRPSDKQVRFVTNCMHLDLRRDAGIKDENKREAIINAVLGVDIPDLDEEEAKQPKGQSAPQAEAERTNDNDNEKGKGGEAK